MARFSEVLLTGKKLRTGEFVALTLQAPSLSLSFYLSLSLPPLSPPSLSLLSLPPLSRFFGSPMYKMYLHVIMYIYIRIYIYTRYVLICYTIHVSRIVWTYIIISILYHIMLGSLLQFHLKLLIWGHHGTSHPSRHVCSSFYLWPTQLPTTKRWKCSRSCDPQEAQATVFRLQ